MKFLKKLFGKVENVENSEKIKEEAVEEKKNYSGQVVEIYSPFSGTILDLSEIPDAGFASGVLGEGVGLEPNNKSNIICAPCATDEIGIFDTKHAVTLETKEGLELIVHFGIDTVQLDGKGFEQLVENESPVKQGDELVKFDYDFINKNAKSVRTPVLIANMEVVESIERMTGEVKSGDLLMKVKLK